MQNPVASTVLHGRVRPSVPVFPLAIKYSIKPDSSSLHGSAVGCLVVGRRVGCGVGAADGDNVQASYCPQCLKYRVAELEAL